MKTLGFFILLTFFSTNIYCPVSKQGFIAKTDHIKNLKEFWVQIYTEVSVNETVFHDRFDPLVIYKKVSHPDMGWASRNQFVKKSAKELEEELRSIYDKKFVNLSEKEQILYDKAYSLISSMKYKDLIKRIRPQQGMREKFKKGIEISYKYLDYIKDILKKEGVPEDLAYLPHVESSFNYRAYSKVGAAGIWQFMRRSGRHYKLKINRSVDERLDPLKAAEAAAKMLKDNYRILGTWPLAITGYNHGPYGIKRVVREVGSHDISEIVSNYSSRSFSFASRNFYASYLAAVQVAKNYGRYYKELNPEKLITFDQVVLKRSIRVKSLLKKHDISWKVFKLYNPFVKNKAHRRNYYLKKGTILNFPKEELIVTLDEKK